MSRSDAQRIDDLEHHLMVAESMGREFESALARKDAALKAAVDALAYAANNARERLESLDDWEQEDRERWHREDVHSAEALAACREAMK